MSAPPRHSRAMFIAALCIAAVRIVAPRQPIKLRQASPSAIERRDRSLRHIAKSVGRAIIAQQRAARAFEQTGRAWSPQTPAAAKLDPRIACLIECERITRAIGQLVTANSMESAWVELKQEPPRVSIFWRGEPMRGERIVSKLVMEGSKPVIRKAAGTVGGMVRDLDRGRFGEAVEAAALALDAAGFTPSGLVDIRYLKVGADADQVDTTGLEGFHFKGLVATIGLRRELPKWMQQSRAKVGFSRAL